MSCSERGSLAGRTGDARALRSVIMLPIWGLVNKFRQDKDSECLNFEANPPYDFLISNFLIPG